MKRYFFTSLWLVAAVAAVACSTNRPAEDPANSSNDEMQPASATSDSTRRAMMPDDLTGTSDAGSAPDTIGTGDSAPDRDRDDDKDAPVVAPPPADDPKVAADNTKKNQRDQKDALTPMDQGNNQSDLDITTKIRQAVMEDDSLSFTAKNVKIITVKGKVTLRGPVNSAAERTAIDAVAKRIAGAGKVDNQLEVKK
jgi:hyperosmotically inducible periplasmic protein